MSKFERALAAFAAACLFAAPLAAEISGLPGATDNPYMNRHVKGSKMDPSVLRDLMDESASLFDSLARETRGLDKSKVEPLFVSLRDEYHQGDFVGKSRKALRQAEDVLGVQDAVKAQAERCKDPLAPDADKEEARLSALKTDEEDAKQGLRDTLHDLHSNATEDVNRDLHNWLMVSEGLLRTKREDAAAHPASPTAAVAITPSAEALSADGLSPTADAVAMSPSAVVTTIDPKQSPPFPPGKGPGDRVDRVPEGKKP